MNTIAIKMEVLKAEVKCLKEENKDLRSEVSDLKRKLFGVTHYIGTRKGSVLVRHGGIKRARGAEAILKLNRCGAKTCPPGS